MVRIGKTVRPKVKLNRKKTVETKYGRSKIVGRKFASVPKVRKSLQPGAVLILLSGSYKGKRVVLLKVLESGLLVVTGPFSFNGVPLRRVNPRYVIATSTNVYALEGVDGAKCKAAVEAVVAPLTDKSFGKTSATKIAEFKERKKRSKGKDSMFVEEASSTAKSAEDKSKIVESQDKVDGVLVPFLKKSEILCQYLKSLFTLRNNMHPHLLKF
ncbi:60S ribosomal protein L6, putative [Theileria equi strain WA]|uniref:60S ribosomal protein L6, putative n=1 Tax=Theileria equi strain WA TaxID=1537102 RepID=L0B0N6_THEEQ|nr:60S ribosomal protein L6, putative [Theileria equi strain WA]AFZ81397.1 60S ribosomal protein L6, putative [Theileria equi strain WA]|eukprot:XP_004831063.1 60S ribosomal protein L6, putative [Theileria equi strain WA]